MLHLCWTVNIPVPKLPEILAVPQSDTARAVNFDGILVVLFNLHHRAGSIPAEGVIPEEILDRDKVSY